MSRLHHVHWCSGNTCYRKKAARAGGERADGREPAVLGVGESMRHGVKARGVQLPLPPATCDITATLRAFQPVQSSRDPRVWRIRASIWFISVGANGLSRVPSKSSAFES